MTNQWKGRDETDKLLDKLLTDLVEERLSGLQREQLERILREDSQARAHYLKTMRLHALLEIRHAPLGTLPVDPAPQDHLIAQDMAENSLATTRLGLLSGWPRQTIDFFTMPTPLSLTIATLALLGAIVAMSMVYLGSHDGPIAKQDVETLQPELRLVGRVVASRDCVMNNSGTVPRSGDPLHAGEILDLKQGLMQIASLGGAKVLLQAPVRLRLDGENRLTLFAGSLSAHVPLPARGFTVETSSARLVDLGTRFGARVEPHGATILRVTEGLVEAMAKDRKGVVDSGRKHLVRSGQTLRIESSGKATKVPPGKHEFAHADELEISDALRLWRKQSAVRSGDPDLVAYYTFEKPETSGTRAGRLSNRASSSSRRHHGRLGDGADAWTRPRWATGRWAGKGALRLDATLQQRVFINDWPAAGIDREMTVAAWVRPLIDNPSHTFVTVWSLQGQLFHLSAREHGLTVRLSNDGRNSLDFLQATDGKPIARREGWVHVALTLVADGGPVRLYKNGRMINLGGATYRPKTFPKSSSPLVIGGRTEGGSCFAGLIDELSIYRRALSADEIARLAEEGKPKQK